MSKVKKEYQDPLKLDLSFEEALERFGGIDTNEIPFETLEESQKPFPFVKWAGGKRNIIQELKARLPKSFNRYYEPFVGGGALFFDIHKEIKEALLSDTNLELVFAYNVIQKDPKSLIELLKFHAQNHCEKYYYKLRSQGDLQAPIEIAARFIYLNKTCYNGLYRVNKKGIFNVPMGRYKNPGIVKEENLLAGHQALKNAKIEYRDFESISPESGDFVYFDPPYHPVNEISFTSFTKLNFTETDQVRLMETVIRIHKKGVKVMLSNSNTKFIKDIYKSNIFNIKVIEAPRFVNCKPGGRTPVEEVLITTY